MILSDLSEEEAYLFVLFQDESGIDQAEFCLIDDSDGGKDGCFRAWPFQYGWLRKSDPKMISQGSRSCGKSLSAKLRAFAFPFIISEDEMVITAPEGAHLDALTDNIETLYTRNKIAKSMLSKDRRGRITHRPFQMNFNNGSRILTRLPKWDGSGVRGTHPVWLVMDEGCFPGDSLVLTEHGYVEIKDVNVGDRVWTHQNRWRKVTNVINQGVKDLVEIRAQGHSGLRTTANHRFWSQRVLDYKDRKNKWGIKEKSDHEWIPAGSLQGNLISHPSEIDSVDLPDVIPASNISTSYPIDPLSDAFLWCLGLYIAEGSTSSNYGTGGVENKVTWSVHVDEVDEVSAWLDKAGLKSFAQPVQNTENCMNIVVCHKNLAAWIEDACGHLCYNKKIPLWVHSLPREKRQFVYDGIIYGDGCDVIDDRYCEGHHRLSTTSRALVYDFQMLAYSLGRFTSVVFNKGGKVRNIRGREFVSGPSYSVSSRLSGQSFREAGFVLDKVKAVKDAGSEVVYDLTVEEDHSFVVEGMVVHNSFYPEPGWKEIVETVKRGDPRSRWMVHGVTIGPGNTFDDKISRDNEWNVSHLPALYRPNWTEEERHSKVEEYGSVDDPDFRRNVYGVSAHAGTPLLVMHRLMSTVDTDELSDYNQLEYFNAKITDGNVNEVDDILDLVDPPISHSKMSGVWMGMDYGLTTSNSCIVVFTEHKDKKDKHSKLKLVTKLILTRISTEDQIKVILHLMDMYRPKVLAFDSHGIGQPAYEWLQKESKTPGREWILDRLKGYSFSKKVIIGFDENMEIPEHVKDGWKDAAIDALREYVHPDKLLLPYDTDLIGELSAIPRKEPLRLDEYGKPRRKKGQHILDAVKFALLAHSQAKIDEIIDRHNEQWTAPAMVVLDYV